MFDGLLALDEDLRLLGRLAERWQLGANVYLLLPATVTLLDGWTLPADSLAEELSGLADSGRQVVLMCPSGLSP